MNSTRDHLGSVRKEKEDRHLFLTLSKNMPVPLFSYGSHRPLARARLVQWMNENHMKTSVTTGEGSLRWAKKADQRAKSSENGPISPNCYLLGLRRRLDYGPRRQKYHENAGNNHLKTVNIRSNGKSRLPCGTDS